MIIGKVSSGNVYIDGELLDPAPSQKLWNHSPDGFMWGYNGSGPAQLALAILLHFSDEEFARVHYQMFKTEVIAKQDKDKNLKLSTGFVKEWIQEYKK